jgi:hypothetical protein
MAPGGRSELAHVFLQLGYDINDSDDMMRLAADLRWVEDRRKSAEAFRAKRWAALGTIIITVGGAAGTLLVQWLWDRFVKAPHP